MIIMAILASLLAVLILWNLLEDLYLIYKRGMPPGPLSLPIIGGLHHLSPSAPNKSLVKLARKYPKIFSLRLGPAGRVVIVQDLEMILKLYKMREAADRPSLGGIHILNGDGDGLGSVPYGKKWIELTKIFHTGMTQIRQKSFNENSLKVLSKTVEMFSKHVGTIYNPSDVIKRTFYAINSMLIYSVEETDIYSPEIDKSIENHKALMTLLNPVHPVNLMPALWKVPSSFKTWLTKCLNDRDEVLQDSFDRHIRDHNGTINDIMDITADFMIKQTTMTTMTTTAATTPQDDIKLPDLMLTMWTIFMAASDTLVDTCHWMTLYLALNPEVQTKIQREIDSNCSGSDPITTEHKERFHFTRAVIFETLRMASSVFLGIPHCNRTDIDLGGYTIPKGTTIMTYVWSVHHDPDLWEEPKTFKPERFLQPDGTLYPLSHINGKMPFIAWGRGKRPCIGKHLSIDLMFLYLTAVMRKFKIETVPDAVPNLEGKIVFNLMPADYEIILRNR